MSGQAPFDSLLYERIDLPALLSGLRRARLRLRLAFDESGALRAVREAQAMVAQYRQAKDLARLRAALRLSDKALRREADLYIEHDCKVQIAIQQFAEALISSRFRPGLERLTSREFIRRADNFRRQVRADALPLLEEETRLIQAAASLAMRSVSWNGALLPPDALCRWLRHPDRDLRRQAHLVWAEAASESAGERSELFDRLNSCRRKLAAQLGFASFAELAACRLERFDLSTNDAAALNATISRYFLPISAEIRRLQRRRLGLESLAWYDLPCLLPQTEPDPIAGTPTDMAAAVDRIWSDAAERDEPILGELERDGCLDLEPRTDKEQGSLCLRIDGLPGPFIRMQVFDDGESAWDLLSQSAVAWSMRRNDAGTDRLIPSRGEFTLPRVRAEAISLMAARHLDRLFGDAAGDAAALHLTRMLLELPVACQVDAFESRMHAPATEEGRSADRIWQELERRYRPELDWQNAPWLSEGGAWQLETGIFDAPFRRFDQLLATLCALDLWSVSRKTPQKGWRQFLTLDESGGNLLEQLDSAGLGSPFRPDTLKRIAYSVCDALAL